MKEEVVLTDLSITLSMTTTDDNTSIIFFEQPNNGAKWQCGVELGSGTTLELVAGTTTGQGTEKLVITTPFPSPTSVSRFIVSCQGAAVGRPEGPSTPNDTTHAMFTIHVTDTELGAVHTDDLEVTILDTLSITHAYTWGDTDKWFTPEIVVDFQLYLPSTMGGDIKEIYLRHPLLHLDTITSMHVPPTANRLEDLGRPYHFIKLNGFSSFFYCKYNTNNICAKIVFDRVSQTRESVARATFTNPEGEACVCTFSIPYPPDVLQYMLHQSQSQNPPHVSILKKVASGDSAEPFVEIVSIPIQEPRIIPIRVPLHVRDQTGVYIWHSSIHSHANMAEFELGIAVTNHAKYFSPIEHAKDRIQFRLDQVTSARDMLGGGGDDGDLFAEGSLVMACRAHNTLDYPDDIPLVNGVVDITTGEFNRYGKTCRFRFSNNQSNPTRTMWHLSPLLIAKPTPSDTEPQTIPHTISLFDAMHEPIFHYSLDESLQLHDVAAVDPSQPFSDHMQPIIFTEYTRSAGDWSARFARATIDITSLLPYDIRLDASGFQLAVIFPNRREFYGLFPRDPYFALTVKKHGIIRQQLRVNAYSYYFAKVLDLNHVDPLESIFQTGRPLRAPFFALFDSSANGLVLKAGETIEATLEFQTSGFNPEHEPIYLALLSRIDLKTGIFTPQYAKITPAKGDSKHRTLAIILGSLFGFVVLMALAVGIICCRRNSMACFRKRRYEYDYNYDSELDTQLPS